MHSGVIDTAVTKIGDCLVAFFCKFEAILKKALTCVSRKLTSKGLCHSLLWTLWQI
jgi:hypothetical protein